MTSFACGLRMVRYPRFSAARSQLSTDVLHLTGRRRSGMTMVRSLLTGQRSCARAPRRRDNAPWTPALMENVTQPMRPVPAPRQLLTKKEQ